MAKLALAMDEILGPDSDDPATEVIFADDHLSVGRTPPAPAPRETAEEHDRKLRAQIRRVTSYLSTPFINKLSDRGEKFKRKLAEMKDELARRDKKENGAGVKASKPASPGPYEWIDETDNLYCKNYESYLPLPTTKFYRKGGGAFTKELSLIGGNKRKRTENINLIHSNSKERPSRIFCDEDRYEKISSSCRFSKRRKVTKRQDSFDGDMAAEVSNVVLLDDEDVQTLDLDPPGKDIPDKWKECKMYYPSRNDPEAIELTYSDIKCLDPAEYLSSPVMNFYIQYLKRSFSRDSNSKQSFYIFNTYFYQKLDDAFNAKADHDSIFMKLRRWWKGVNIFEKAYIILPIHGRMHWSLIIICIPAKESRSGPFILHLDSLGCHSTQTIFDTIEWFLRKEYKHVGQDSPKIFLSRMHKEKVSVPQQKNEYDCGLFVLYFTERFIREAPDRFTIDNIGMFNRKWFKSEEASGLRQRIRALLIEELESVRLEDQDDKSDTISDSSDSV